MVNPKEEVQECSCTRSADADGNQRDGSSRRQDTAMIVMQTEKPVRRGL
jgi:hypothetical protein